MKNIFIICVLVSSLAICAEEKGVQVKTFKFKMNPGDVILGLVDEGYGNAKSTAGTPVFKDAYSADIKDDPFLSLKIIPPEGYTKKGLIYKIIFRDDRTTSGSDYKSKIYSEVLIEHLVKDTFIEDVKAPDFEILCQRDEKNNIAIYTIPIVSMKDKTHVIKLYIAKDLKTLKSAVSLPKESKDYLDSVIFRK